MTRLDAGGVLTTTTFLKPSSATTVLACAFDDASGPGYQPGLYLTGQTGGLDAVIDPAIPSAGASQTELAGFNDAFVAKFDPTLADLVYFNLLGGSFQDTGTAIAVKGGVAVITGLAESYDLPVTDRVLSGHTLDEVSGQVCGNYYHPRDCLDTFAARVRRDGLDYDFVTFLGEPLADFGTGVAVDGAMTVYLTGTVVLSGVSTRAFVVRLNRSGSAVLYRLDYGSPQARGSDIAADDLGIAHVIGDTGMSPLAVGDALDPTYNGERDGFYAQLDPGGTLISFTYLGGPDLDRGYRLALDDDRCVFLGLETWSDSFDFPLPGAPQAARAGGADVLILRHCDPGDPAQVILAKTVDPPFVEPGGTTDFRIEIDNPGAPIPGSIEITDRPPLPFQATAVTGDGCRIDGRDVICEMALLPSGPTTVTIEAANRLECARVGQFLQPRVNTAYVRFPNDIERDLATDVFYRECVPPGDVGDDCLSTAQCSDGLLCARPCESFFSCAFQLGPICIGRQDWNGHGPPVCAVPAVVGGCDDVLP